MSKTPPQEDGASGAIWTGLRSEALRGGLVVVRGLYMLQEEGEAEVGRPTHATWETVGVQGL